MNLVQAVLGQAPLTHLPVSRLDVRSGQLTQWQLAEALRKAPHVELVAFVSAWPDPLSCQLQPDGEEKAHRHFARTDWQSLGEQPTRFSEPTDHLAPGRPVDRFPPSARQSDLGFPA